LKIQKTPRQRTDKTDKTSFAQTSADQSMEQKQKSERLPSDMAINSPAAKKQFAF
jgi:hypothetical protein